MNFGNLVKMNERALAKDWNNNDRILEDVFESFMGALFIDKGFDMCKKWILQQVVMDDEEEMVKDTNYKDILMKHAHTSGMNAPEYRVFKENGPEHDKLFTVQVYINNMLLSNGRAATKKKSEQIAALKALECLGIVE
jgi:ribonuclease-3